MQGVNGSLFYLHNVKKGFAAGLMGLEMGLGWHPLAGPPGGPPGGPPADPDEEDMVEHFLMFN